MSDDKRVVAVRFTPELYDELRTAADERVVSVNFLVVRAVERLLDDLVPIDEVLA